MTKGTMDKKEKDLNGKSIIVIALNGIGNTLLATPLFTSLKRSYPLAKLSVLALADSAGALRGNPSVDEVIIYPGKEGFLKRMDFLRNLRKRKFDVSFYPYPNVNIMSAIIGQLIGAKQRVNFEYMLMGKPSGFLDSVSVPVDLSKHDVDKNLDLLFPFGAKKISKELFIPISKEDKKAVDGLLKGKTSKNDVLIGMHVGSKESMRVWPTENFAKIVELLKNHSNIRIILVGTAIEADLIKGFAQFQGENIISLISRATISQTTEAIGKCDLFITTDSGPMHMAVAAKTKVIAIYLGPHIKRTSPYGKEHFAFVTNRTTEALDKNKNHMYVNKVTPEMVYERVKEDLKI